MKAEMLDDLPKHRCAKPGSPWLAFAPLDFPVMEAMITRDASTEEVNAQVRAWIAADAAKNPNPTEPAVKRFQAAMLSNIPFVVYCGLCLEPICLIHPEEKKEEQP